MKPLFDDVLLFCPEVPTGGPEAMHQLSHAINSMGGRAHMVYYDGPSRVEINGNVIRNVNAQSPMPAHFAHYQPKPLQEMALTERVLAIYPEPAIDVALQPAANRRAIWWLSVDNAVGKFRQLADAEQRRRLFLNSDILHFCQSDYARQFLGDCVKQAQMLSDYTDPALVVQSASTQPIVQRPKRLCFFPTKGAALAKRFLTEHPLPEGIEVTAIHGMSKAQVRETLLHAQIYIDFGNQPGKDRVPREAAVAGAVILLHATGAAKHPLDHPLAPQYLFTADDIGSGKLHQLVADIFANPAIHAAAQAKYRKNILGEQPRFNEEVRAVFFTD